MSEEIAPNRDGYAAERIVYWGRLEKTVPQRNGRHLENGRPLRILLVEDDEPNRTVFADLLARRGYTVTAVASAVEAVDVAEGERFDLLVCDIGLPDEDGWVLMRRLSHLQPQLVGIATSGYGMSRDLARSRDAGFVAHLTKPILIADLDEIIVVAFGLGKE